MKETVKMSPVSPVSIFTKCGDVLYFGVLPLGFRFFFLIACTANGEFSCYLFVSINL